MATAPSLPSESEQRVREQMQLLTKVGGDMALREEIHSGGVGAPGPRRGLEQALTSQGRAQGP